MKVAIVTLGCRTNQAESSSFADALLHAGHTMVDMQDNPDLCIINSCSVTAKADAQSRQLVSRNLKQGRSVIITGCYAHLNREYLASRFPGITIVSNEEKSSLPSLVPLTKEERFVTLQAATQSRHRPIIKVQDGCDNRCSYCIIPQARGASRSRPLPEVLAEAARLETEGFRELVLSGIHLGMYGKDMRNGTDLATLVERVLLCTKDVRIRLSSLEVQEINDRLLELMQDRRLCRHLHIPLQSASDTVLRRMNRQYDKAYYEKCMRTIQNKLGNIAIGTDVIVGFPQETDEEFHETRTFLERNALAYLHVFPYSRRPGTQADLMSGHVAEAVKKERAATIKELGRTIKRRFMDSQIGQTVDVLIERLDKNVSHGMSSAFFKVRIEHAKKRAPGSIVPVRIVGVFDDVAEGVPENDR